MADNRLYPAVSPTRLSASVAAAATSMTVAAVKDRLDNTLTMTDFGSKGFGVIEPGGSKEEHFVFTGISSTTISGISWVTMKSPYTETSGFNEAHAAGVRVILYTNSPAFYNDFTNKNNEETIAQIWTFNELPTLDSYEAPTANAQFAPKKYVDDVAAGGTATIDRVVVAGTAGETVSAGQLLYFDTGSNNEWMKCDADTAATVENVILGIAQGAGVDGGTIAGGVLTHGLDSNQSGMTAGDPMFASNTAGAISASAGTVEVQIGAARNATTLYFSPRFNQQLTEDEQDAIAGTSGTPSSTNKFVTNDDTSVAASGSKVPRGASGKLGNDWLNFKFGGTGADGALAVTSGTTTIDLGSAAVVVKNYTSISITGTGAIAFSNPHANGSLIILKSQGAVTITSSATRAIDLRSLGATGGAGGTGAAFTDGADGTDNADYIDALAHYGVGGAGDGATGGAAGAAVTSGNLYSDSANDIVTKRMLYLVPGSGGGGGEAGNGVNYGAGGDGGRGAGSLIIECQGAYNCTGTIDASGTAGTAGAASGAASGGGGGGGGGAGSMVVVLYNTLTADSGTYTVTAGAAGGGGAGNGGTGGAGGGGAALLAAGAAGSANTGANGGAGGAGAAGVAVRTTNTVFF